jgi:hypothetical protein
MKRAGSLDETAAYRTPRMHRYEPERAKDGGLNRRRTPHPTVSAKNT